VLIKAMRATSKSFRNEWKLILCGSVPNNAADRAYFKELQESVGNDIHVEFVLSPPTTLVDSLYAQASIYAHACGFGVREPEEYWQCEHFGITLVEAIVAGCHVVCYEVGGGPEIIQAVGSGAVYGSIDELVSQFHLFNEWNVDDGARVRAATLFGDEAFSSRLTAVVG
jgi:glycosyltransferase involved in cell wall biosynthesis